VAKRPAGFVEHLAERHIHRLELRQPALPFGSRQRREQVVSLCLGSGGHMHTLPQTPTAHLRVGACTCR